MMNIEIANRLVQLRKEKGLSQEELADKLGLSRQAVSKWERAEASPDTDNLICLAKIYGVSLDDLLNTDESPENIAKEVKEAQEEKKVQEEKKKSTVNIGDRGIHIVDGDDEVHIGKDGIHISEGGKAKHIYSKRDSRHEKIKGAISGVYVLLVVIAFLLLGFFLHAWHVAWILFVTIPLPPTIIDVIKTKKITAFAYPVFITAVYLFLGMQFNFWHPYWFVFITIPLFYAIFEPIQKLWLKDYHADHEIELDFEDKD